LKSQPPAPPTAESQPAASAGAETVKITLTPLQQLQKAIQEFPLDLENYFRMADIYAADDKFADAERTLRTALDISGRDLKVQEKLEDLHLRRARHQVLIAEQRAAKAPSEQAAELAKRLKEELNLQELQVYRGRCERYPNITRWKFELGVRVKRTGNLPEAAKLFEAARNDPDRGGLALLEWGESLQGMKQYQPALERYLEALAALPEKAVEARKLALYRAGVLAAGLKQFDLADRHLSTLAGLDFNYKDVAERLDKLQQMRHK
jgi:tetratricopeptide (TPR) repeat protein